MAWPLALKGADLVGLAETGSGKTLAYLLPAMMHVQRVKSTKSNGTGPIALVLAPTRELVMQIQWEASHWEPTQRVGEGESQNLHVLGWFGWSSWGLQRKIKLKQRDMNSIDATKFVEIGSFPTDFHNKS